MLGAFKLIYDNCEGFRNFINNFIQTIKDFFTGLWEGIKAIFSTVRDWIYNNVILPNIFLFMLLVETVKSFFINLWEGIKVVFSAVVGFFTTIFTNAWNGIKNAFSSVTSFFSNIWETIKSMFTKIGSAIGDGISGAFKSVVNAVINFAENSINGFIRAINKAIGVINNIPGVEITKITELSIPRLKIGHPNIPYDDYLAFLHKGERVLTAEENRAYNEGKNGQTIQNIDNSVTVTNYSPESISPSESARQTRLAVRRQQLQRA